MRQKLPTRRCNITFPVQWGEMAFTLTVGFEANTPTIATEVFADPANPKAKSQSLGPLLRDACVLVSRELQHGSTPAAMRASLHTDKDYSGDRPGSVIGAIVEAITPERLAEVWNA